jgi:hypothetical protein
MLGLVTAAGLKLKDCQSKKVQSSGSYNCIRGKKEERKECDATTK